MLEMERLDLRLLLQVISLYPPGICALLSGAKQLTLLLTHISLYCYLCKDFYRHKSLSPLPLPNCKHKTKV